MIPPKQKAPEGALANSNSQLERAFPRRAVAAREFRVWAAPGLAVSRSKEKP